MEIKRGKHEHTLDCIVVTDHRLGGHADRLGH